MRFSNVLAQKWIIIAMPSAKVERRKAILDICKETGCALKMLPGISQMLNGQAKLSQLRDVSVEELLGREPVKTDMTEIAQYIKGKTVMVAGGGGSIGSELARQIASYGPVTVTHPDITRFFMTIPEAVSLVLQAGAYATGGEIFILDMGQPVKIDELARNLIFLSGRIPGEDIQIKYTGLRPGEKLYEELLMSEEGLLRTDNDKIWIGRPLELCDDLFARINELNRCAADNDDEIKLKVAELVSSYKPDLQQESCADSGSGSEDREPEASTIDLDIEEKLHKKNCSNTFDAAVV